MKTAEDNEGLTEEASSIGNIISNISNLKINTTYYIRLYAMNSLGTS